MQTNTQPKAPIIASNIVLIGMPGSGKSTLGRRLANLWGTEFVDTDSLIEELYGQKIQQLLEQHSVAQFHAVEERVLCSMALNNHVIATGGSAVYSETGMAHLKQLGRVIYLSIRSETLLERVNNSAVRGLVRQPGQSLESLHDERRALYEQWSDLELSNDQPLDALRLNALATQIMGSSE